ncbi:MAG: hypothetical protein H6502_02000 [Candidatus Woesearchaeota archaeon]|nr:MAG: hypothetical protein H6502_02000 [Candidatus Woesearchaeota archaeon]
MNRRASFDVSYYMLWFFRFLFVAYALFSLSYISFIVQEQVLTREEAIVQSTFYRLYFSANGYAFGDPSLVVPGVIAPEKFVDGTAIAHQKLDTTRSAYYSLIIPDAAFSFYLNRNLYEQVLPYSRFDKDHVLYYKTIPVKTISNGVLSYGQLNATLAFRGELK